MPDRPPETPDEERTKSSASEETRTGSRGGEDDATIIAHVEPVSQSIAGYRIIRKLGEGGMGVVYEAEQQDPRRSVALKVIRGGSAVNEQMVRLFQREVQTLARLKHPGIASIYEAGHTEEGQHFFAMELIRGVPLNEFFRAHALPASPSRKDYRERLSLFLKICEAINYAHQRGVIHRDLKPSNIFILSLGKDDPQKEVQVKVLDFGLARITDPEAESVTVLTEVGQIQGTLPYMSPEQARGLPDEIDLRTDVYALGVILYQLLTDQLPYTVTRTAIHEAVRVICEEPPQRPSSLCRQLRGDLETIALKALEKDPERRYQTAFALAGDVERYLTDQPILARPPSATYQLRKLMARHKGPFAFAGVLVLLLAVFAILMSAMFGIQRKERLRADAEREKAEQINSFLQGMLASIDPEQARGREVTVREVLDKSAETVQEGLRDQPEVRAEVHRTIGNTYRALGLYDDAEPHLQNALEIHRTVLETDDPELAVSMNDLAAVYWEKGDYQTAEPLFREALALDRQLLGSEDPAYASSLSNLGLLLKSRGNYAEAESLYLEALEIRKHRLAADDPEVATTLGNLASLLQAEGNFAGAESLYGEALLIRREKLGDDHPDLVVSLNNLSTVKLRQGKYEEAEPLLQEGLEIGKAILGEDHPFVVSTFSNLAFALRKLGRYKESESIYLEALETYRRVVGEQHPAYASTLNNLAGLLRATNRFSEAEELYRKTLQIRNDLLGAEHPDVAVSLNNIGLVLQDQKRFTDAESFFSDALDMRRKLLGGAHPHVASSLVGLATSLIGQNNPVRAESFLRESLRILRAGSSRSLWLTPYAENTLGHCVGLQGRGFEAESLLVRGADRILESSGAPMDRKREALERVIRFFERQGRNEDAIEYRKELLLLES